MPAASVDLLHDLHRLAVCALDAGDLGVLGRYLDAAGPSDLDARSVCKRRSGSIDARDVEGHTH